MVKIKTIVEVSDNVNKVAKWERVVFVLYHVNIALAIELNFPIRQQFFGRMLFLFNIFNAY